MKFPFSKRYQEQGSALMVTIFVTAAVLLGMASFLMLVRSQYVSVARSESWNSAMAMAEAGVEEAMAQLNPGALARNIAVNRSANGWGSPSGGKYGPVSRTVGSSGSYSVLFTDTTFPTIYSTGYVRLPDISATLTRVLRVTTTNVPLYNISLAARTNISMSGSGMSANSFDSSNPSLSTNGRYDTSKTTTNGDVAVLYGNLDIGNHNISGDVLLGPTATFSGNANQVSGSIQHDFNSDFPQVVLPADSTSWISLLVPQPGVVGGTAYTYVFNTDGDYVIAAMTGSIYVNTNAHVRLLIQSGNIGGVLVAGSGVMAGKLTAYIAAPSFSIGGSGTVDGGQAANLTIFGLPSNTTMTLDGNAFFTGTLYAPSTSLTLNGGGNNSYDFVGSCVVASVTFNGHFMFHFDQDLLNSGASRGYLATSWTEL